jgi:hypothetical protein
VRCSDITAAYHAPHAQVQFTDGIWAWVQQRELTLAIVVEKYWCVRPAIPKLPVMRIGYRHNLNYFRCRKPRSTGTVPAIGPQIPLSAPGAQSAETRHAVAELRAAEAAVRVAEADVARAMLADNAARLANKAAIAIPSTAAGSESLPVPVTPPRGAARQQRAQARLQRAAQLATEGAAAVTATARAAAEGAHASSVHAEGSSDKDMTVSQLDNGWKRITTRRKRGNRRDCIYVLEGGEADGRNVTVRSQRAMRRVIAARALANGDD